MAGRRTGRRPAGASSQSKAAARVKGGGVSPRRAGSAAGVRSANTCPPGCEPWRRRPSHRRTTRGAGMPQKRIYFFGGGKAEGNKDMKNLLGGKGADLAEMTNIGIPVPPGFTITTEVCTEFYAERQEAARRSSTPSVARRAEEGRGAHRARSSATRRTRCSSPSAPARASRCPGMMDTVLNLGLNDETVAGARRAVGQRALRLGQLPPLRRHVRRRRARAEAREARRTTIRSR